MSSHVNFFHSFLKNDLLFLSGVFKKLLKIESTDKMNNIKLSQLPASPVSAHETKIDIQTRTKFISNGKLN